MLEEFQKVQAAHPEIEDNRLKVLLMYDHVRTTNTWVKIHEEHVSMSRFFRAAFLGDIFEGSELDIQKVQAAIDERTKAKDLGKQ
jgi:hypothetical protein